MSKKIIFQKCNINYIYFLLYLISYALTFIIGSFVDKDEFLKADYINKEDNHFYLSYKLFQIYISNISDFMSIIPLFIRKILTRRSNANSEQIEITDIDDKNSENNQSKSLSILIYNDFIDVGAEKRSKIILFYCFLVALFDFTKDIIEIFFYMINKDEDFQLYPFNFAPIFDIILQFIFSYLILKTHFYKLHFFSLFLNITICLIIFAIDLTNYLIHKSFCWQLFLFYPGHLLFYCLKSVYGKKVILYGYISVYLLIIIKGVIKIFLNILLSLVILLVKKDIFTEVSFFFRENKYIKLIICFIFANFFWILFLWIIIDRLSPNHLCLVLIGEELISFIFHKISIQDNEIEDYRTMGWDIYIRIFLYVISFLGVIIYNETVIINICGLGSDTKYFLDLEVLNEERYSKEENPEVLKRYETFIEMDEQDDETKKNEDENQNNND